MSYTATEIIMEIQERDLRLRRKLDAIILQPLLDLQLQILDDYGFLRGRDDPPMPLPPRYYR